MKDKALWTIIIIFAVLALLDWMGVRGDDLCRSVRDLTHGDNRLLGWAILALVTYTVYRVINHLTKS
jgi:hypothetical protein